MWAVPFTPPPRKAVPRTALRASTFGPLRTRPRFSTSWGLLGSLGLLLASLVPFLGLGVLVASPARAAVTTCWWVNASTGNASAPTAQTQVWTIPGGSKSVVWSTFNGVGAGSSSFTFVADEAYTIRSYSVGSQVTTKVVADGTLCSYVGDPHAIPTAAPGASQSSVDALATKVAALPTAFPTPLSTVAIDGDQYAALLAGGGGGSDPSVVALTDDQFYVLGTLLSILVIVAIGTLVYNHGRRRVI